MSLLQDLVLDRQVLLGGMASAGQSVHPPQFSGASTGTQSSCFQLKRNLLRTIMQITNSAGGQGIRLGGGATFLQRLRVEMLLPQHRHLGSHHKRALPAWAAPPGPAPLLCPESATSPQRTAAAGSACPLPDAARQWKSRAGASDRGVQVT